MIDLILALLKIGLMAALLLAGVVLVIRYATSLRLTQFKQEIRAS